MQHPLQEQVAIITGGSRGIGAAVAKKLGALGAHVVIGYSQSPERAREVLSAIEQAGGRGECVGFDVSDPEAVTKAFADIHRERGRIDILINNAGVSQDGLILRTKNEDWKNTIDVNLSSAFYCSREAAKIMFRARYGRIVNMSSVIGQSGNAGQAPYAASKAGMLGLTKSLAKELGSRGITVNAITPGYIATEMTAGFTDDMQTRLLSQIPIGRLGTVDDVADATCFLVLPTSSYITGQVIGVNGGLYM